jgi:hypothetical protein
VEKRTATISSRVPSELEAQIQAIALARDVTVSDLICHALADLVECERRTYERLRPAFEAAPDLPGRPSEDGRHGK